MTTWVLSACRNRAAITSRFLDQLAAQGTGGLHLLMVDDGSEDRTPAILAAESRFRISTIRGDGSLYWGGSMRLAMSRAKQLGAAPGDSVLFSNDDVLLPPRFVESGNLLLERNPGCMVLATGVSTRDGSVFERGQIIGPWRLSPRPPRPGEAPNCAPTRGLFIAWRDAERVGLFAASSLPHYLSDYDWTMRAVRLGIAIRVHDELRILVDVERSGQHGLGDTRGRHCWRRIHSRTYASNPEFLVRFAGRNLGPLRGACELLWQSAVCTLAFIRRS